MKRTKDALKVEKLSRAFKVKDHWNSVIREVEFTLPFGCLGWLSGKNGSGKTTLLRILSTCILPTSGHAEIAGFSLIRQTQLVRQHVGWMPASEHAFVPRMTGLENLEFFAKLRGVSYSKWQDFFLSGHSMEIIPLVLSTPFYLASSGMRQCLSFLRATLHQPQILFLDEPLRSLDADNISAVGQMISRFCQKGGTVLMSSHVKPEWNEIPVYRLELQDGHVRIT